jgi:hypothetical protein
MNSSNATCFLPEKKLTFVNCGHLATSLGDFYVIFVLFFMNLGTLKRDTY